MVRIILAASLPLVWAMLADVTPPGIDPTGNVSWWAPLINTGAIGIVLGWFMIRMEPRMRAIEASIDTVSRSLMVAVLSMKSCDRGLQEQAQGIKDETEARHPEWKKT